MSKKLRIDMVDMVKAKAKRNNNEYVEKNIDVNTISEISGMTTEEIKELKIQ